MTTSLRRCAATALTAVALGAVGAVSAADAAQAASVAYAAWASGTDVVLTTAETAEVLRDGVYAASAVCADVISYARQNALPFSDYSEAICVTWVSACVRDAATNGRAIGAVRFYESRTPLCLVR